MTINERNIAKYTAIRNEKARVILANTADDGREGRVFELDCARPASHKISVSKQGQVDVSIKMEINGKIRYIPAECKTNGGRIDDLLTGKNKSAFVIYRLQFTQKHKATKTAPAREEKRLIPAVVVPTDLFLQMLTECNAIKAVAHNGVQDGLAIQPSSKKMYERLTAYIENYGECVLFDRERTYADFDFEGLEI